MCSVGSHSTSEREKKGMTERTDGSEGRKEGKDPVVAYLVGSVSTNCYRSSELQKGTTKRSFLMKISALIKRSTGEKRNRDDGYYPINNTKHISLV